jgi:hypothetical protein
MQTKPNAMFKWVKRVVVKIYRVFGFTDKRIALGLGFRPFSTPAIVNLNF